MTERLVVVLDAIDKANSADPETVPDSNGLPMPAALLYGRRMSQALASLSPGASEELAIACRAQHLERWLLPRQSYPQTKEGYYAWRNEQKRRHAERVSAIMAETGYEETACSRVASLIRKEGIKRDTEAQTLEDAACLVFLEHHAAAFAATRDEAQIVDILRKTWRKMSDTGHAAALRLPLHRQVRALVERAQGLR